MNNYLYPKLAWTGICKNRKLYLPYLASCIGMVMMFCILQSISACPLLQEMRGGGSVNLILTLGKFVVAFFALLFLFYTNSFLIRRRYKEFGLYNMLGMDKRGIGKIVFWESLIVSGISLVLGTALGLLFSKFAELGLLNAIHAEIDYRFTVRAETVVITLGVFAGIFLLLLFKSLWQVRRTDPLSLLHSERTGERAPRANWVLALLGVLLLGGAYYLAVSIKSPLTALVWFFIAVLMVIAATYLLFLSGSVALCRLLQKNKGYYYKKQHFVSVSSMVYRMKRNGAGLASVCILCTMVLVMISSTASLYFGANNTINSRYPNDIELDVMAWRLDNLQNDTAAQLEAGYRAVFDRYCVQPEDVTAYTYAGITAKQNGSVFDPEADTESLSISFDDLRSIYFVTAEEYNRQMGTSLSLTGNDAMVCPFKSGYSYDTFTLNGVTLSVDGTLPDSFPIADHTGEVVPKLLFVISDYEVLRPLDALSDESRYPMLDARCYFVCDLPDTDEDTVVSVYHDMTESVFAVPNLDGFGGYSYSANCRAEQHQGFFGTYGGLFFLGIVLSVIFVFAAAMIIYYKQVSEGYEDQARFSILRKVGMTKEDIRKSIDSQVLTVFFAPLLFAGLHLGFAFPMVWKLLQLFYLNNLRFVILVTVGAYLMFSLLYALLYRATARAYYGIVSGNEE